LFAGTSALEPGRIGSLESDLRVTDFMELQYLVMR